MPCPDCDGGSQAKTAEGLGVSRKALSELVNGHDGISPVMAIRLSRASGGSAESWLTQQMHYGFARMQAKARGIKVRRFEIA